MALNNGNVGFNELVGGLSALKRRARLTGQQVTEQDIKNMSDPIYAAWRAYKPNQMALEEQKRQEMMESKQQLDQAEEQKSAGQMKTGMDALGTGLTAYKTMGGKTPTLAQAGDFVSKGITKGAEIGKTLINGSPTEMLNTTPTLANAGTISSTVTGAPATVGTALTDTVANAAPEAVNAAMNAGVGEPLGELGGTLLGETGSTLGGALGAGMAAAPYAAAGYAAAKYGGNLLENITGKGSSNVGSQFARTVQDPLGGIGAPWLKELGITERPDGTMTTAGYIMNVLNPMLALKKALGGCIIITACTDPHSPEVEIAREYRDKFLTPDQLRGYYMIAEKIVPKIEKSAAFKRFIKKHLVDNLIEYGRHALGKSEEKPRFKSRIITKAFLKLCSVVGQTRTKFVRANGEVF